MKMKFYAKSFMKLTARIFVRGVTLQWQQCRIFEYLRVLSRRVSDLYSLIARCVDPSSTTVLPQHRLFKKVEFVFEWLGLSRHLF